MITKPAKDLFTDYTLQREDVMARVAESLQLDKTRKKQMEDAYNSVSAFLSNDTSYFKNLDIDIYPQGSVRIGTTVRPVKGDEFDLDLVLHIRKLYKDFHPQVIYTELHNKLKGHGIYGPMTEAKNRCVRLNYAGQFHMDILPGCMVVETDLNNINVPDRELKGWAPGNPKGFAEWFLAIANSVQAPILQTYYRGLLELKADVEDLPDDEYYSKTPLQRAVQIMKRYRDIFFENDEEHATSSIVLTTMAALYYNGENSIYQTIENILLRIQQSVAASKELRQPFKVYNPVNRQEDFTEKWTAETYKRFFAFSKDFYEKWTALKKEFSQSSDIYGQLVGPTIYSRVIKEQVQKLGKYSSSGLANAGAILTGSHIRTDRQGNLNETKGYKNERHRDFGGE